MNGDESDLFACGKRILEKAFVHIDKGGVVTAENGR